MKKGTKATILVPSSLAYGDGGGRMKPYATLVFDVEVVDVKNDVAPPSPAMGPPQGAQPKAH
jgi:FKBP-type peptidyl-prolyl cis-trans isomerase FkpA